MSPRGWRGSVSRAAMLTKVGREPFGDLAVRRARRNRGRHRRDTARRGGDDRAGGGGARRQGRPRFRAVPRQLRRRELCAGRGRRRTHPAGAAPACRLALAGDAGLDRGPAPRGCGRARGGRCSSPPIPISGRRSGPTRGRWWRRAARRSPAPTSSSSAARNCGALGNARPGRGRPAACGIRASS